MQERKLAAYRIVENEVKESKSKDKSKKNSKNIPMFEYIRKLIIRYTKAKINVNEDFPEVGPDIHSTEETKYYKVQQKIKIPGNKTFYEFDDKSSLRFPQKTNSALCIDMNYKPEDFRSDLPTSHLKIDEKKTWNSESGVMDKIKAMANVYNQEIIPLKTKIEPTKIYIHITLSNSNQESAGVKKLKQFYHQNHHFYNHDHRKIAKWIYWSLMLSLYDNSLKYFRNEHGDNKPINFNLHQECHLKVMNMIRKQLGVDIARDVTCGGSFFGNNRTVEAMQEMGIMDDNKYTSSGAFTSGSRYRLFSGKSTISPSGKESSLRSGYDPDALPGKGNPPEGAELLARHGVR